MKISAIFEQDTLIIEDDIELKLNIILVSGPPLCLSYLWVPGSVCTGAAR